MLLRLSYITLLLSLIAFPEQIKAVENHPIPEAYVYCTVCHGVLFKGNAATRAPKLTGLSAWYIESQLRAFRNGSRGHRAEDLAGLEMRPMAEMLTEKQISHVSRLIADLPSVEQNDSYSNTSKHGQQLYASCSVCHEADAKGNQSLGAPNLATQDSWYLITQLNNYRNSIRGAENTDIMGIQMRNASSVLKSDQDVADVVIYIKSL